MTSRHHPDRDLAAYALGGLEADEAAAIDAHLAQCASCRAEHARLAEVGALVAHAEPDSFGAMPDAAPPNLEDAVAARFTARNPAAPGRGRRRLALAGAATAVLVAAFLALSGVIDDDAARDLRLSGPAGTAEATLRWRDGGIVEVRLRGARLRPTSGRQVYEMWFVGPDGRVSAGTFRVGSGGQVDLRLVAAPPAGATQLGVTLEPDDSDPNRNGDPVLASPL